MVTMLLRWRTWALVAPRGGAVWVEAVAWPVEAEAMALLRLAEEVGFRPYRLELALRLRRATALAPRFVATLGAFVLAVLGGHIYIHMYICYTKI